MEKKAWKYLSVALEANLKNAAIQAHLSVIDRRKKIGEERGSGTVHTIPWLLKQWQIFISSYLILAQLPSI